MVIILFSRYASIAASSTGFAIYGALRGMPEAAAVTGAMAVLSSLIAIKAAMKETTAGAKPQPTKVSPSTHNNASPTPR